MLDKITTYIEEKESGIKVIESITKFIRKLYF